ncbi:MHYT domain-containing protein [Streptomyces sp. CRN 30]|uniref:MHYT domain-containing protein n=1 Tax=Streptomyces sp. CRN 30 TaxID=3075613 RepID=UPI002A8345BC|nr:MHYT domain-containing protein [Streptomyces sp. CRN 30]
MHADVTQFNYGMITPVLAYLTACLGGALGLRCVTRSLRRTAGGRRGAWLALGAVCIGTGIWTMHFIAMIGFSVTGATIGYDTPLTFLSLAVAVLVVAIGVLIVGYRGASPLHLGIAGVITGGGVAVMHYLGMSSMHVAGHKSFDAVTVTLSVLIAVVAATAALWAAVNLRALWASIGASAVMGAAVAGMHYVGMAAMNVHLDGPADPLAADSQNLLTFLVPVIAGPVGVLVIACVIVMFDPDLLVGGEDTKVRPSVAVGPDGAAAAGDWPEISPRR